MRLAQRLVEHGYLTESDLPRVTEVQKASPARPLHELLIENNFAKEDQVLAALAEEFGMELVDLSNVKVEPETLKAMPLKLVHRRSLGNLPEAGKFGGVILTVSVESRDPEAACRPDACSNRGTLPAIFCVSQQSDLRDAVLDPQNLSHRFITAAVVNIDDFVLGETLKRTANLVGKRRNAVGLVLDRDYYGEVQAGSRDCIRIEGVSDLVIF